MHTERTKQAWWTVALLLAAVSTIGCNISDISRALPQPDEFTVNKITYRFGPHADARIMSAVDSVEKTGDVDFKLYSGGLVCLQYEGITNYEIDFLLTTQPGTTITAHTRSHRLMFDRDQGIAMQFSRHGTVILDGNRPVQRSVRGLNPTEATRVRILSQGNQQTLILDCDTVSTQITRKLASDAIIFRAESGIAAIRDVRLSPLKVVGHAYKQASE